jgi:hypothetical protein
VTDPYGRIPCFLDRSRYFSIKYLLSCTHEAEWTPFQTHYFFFSGSDGNRTRAFGSVAKNSDHLSEQSQYEKRGRKSLQVRNGEIKESSSNHIFSLFLYKQTQTLLAPRRGQIMDEIERSRELIPGENTVNYS